MRTKTVLSFPIFFSSSTADLLIIKEKWWWYYYHCQHYRRDFVTPPAAVKIDVTEHFGNVSLVMIPRSWTKPSRRMKNCWGLSCCLSNGLSWLLILGCLNLFLTTKLTGIVTHTTPSQAVTNATKSNAVSTSWPNCKSYGYLELLLLSRQLMKSLKNQKNIYSVTSTWPRVIGINPGISGFLNTSWPARIFPPCHNCMMWH